jgi:hypothetical protein
VSGKVATKAHGEFAQSMDMIDLMPPGLYEAVITGVDKNVENAQFVEGRYLFSLETRTLDQIRALGGNSPEDDFAFCDRGEGVGNQSGPLPHSPQSGSGLDGQRAKRRIPAAHASQPRAVRDVWRQ